jgi:Tol biopolymer transport system component
VFKSLATVIAALSLVAAGCTDDDAKKNWASACTELELAPVSTLGAHAFTVGRRAGSELVVRGAGSTGRRRLTKQRSPHDYVSEIAWSPDSARIAYTGGTGGWADNAYDDVWVVSAKGGRPERLTHSYEDDWHPVWSPDGTKIAFDRQDDGYNWVYVVNADGTGLRRLTPNFNWSPAWTSDGRISYLNSRGIWVMNADGTHKRLFTRAKLDITGYSSVAPAWSPDGTHVAYSTGDVLWVLNADGTGRRKIYGNRQGGTGTPTWSPDSLRITWTQGGEGDYEIYVAKVDGSEVRQVTDNTAVQDEAPAWSRNGRSIIFTRTCLGPKHGQERERRTAVVIADADGGKAQKLATAPYPVWAQPR